MVGISLGIFSGLGVVLDRKMVQFCITRTSNLLKESLVWFPKICLLKRDGYLGRIPSK